MRRVPFAALLCVLLCAALVSSASAGVIITKTVSPTGPVAPGATLTFTITVRSNATDTNVYVNDVFGANLTYVPNSTTKNGVAYPDHTVPPFPAGTPPNPLGTGSAAEYISILNTGTPVVYTQQAVVGSFCPPAAGELVSNTATVQALGGGDIPPSGPKSASASVLVKDATPPVITPVTPTPGQVLPRPITMPLSFTVVDACPGVASVTATLDGVNIPLTLVPGSPGPGVTGTASGTAATALLTLGPHTVVLTATDGAGNTATTTFTITFGCSLAGLQNLMNAAVAAGAMRVPGGSATTLLLNEIGMAQITTGATRCAWLASAELLIDSRDRNGLRVHFATSALGQAYGRALSEEVICVRKGLGCAVWTAPFEPPFIIQ